MNVVPIQTEMDLGQPKFEDFFLLWPQKVQRKDAERVWLKLKDSQQMEAIIAAYEWRIVWATDDYRFVPNIVRWLKGERWEDELPAEYKPRHQSHAPRPVEDKTKYAPMPEHVKALIAKLRGK